MSIFDKISKIIDIDKIKNNLSTTVNNATSNLENNLNNIDYSKYKNKKVIIISCSLLLLILVSILFLSFKSDNNVSAQSSQSIQDIDNSKINFSKYSPQVMLNFFHAYDEGINVTKNDKRALMWLNKAADSGNEEAKRILLSPKYNKGALNDLIDKANNGDDPSIVKLYDMYITGNGIDKNINSGLQLIFVSLNNKLNNKDKIIIRPFNTDKLLSTLSKSIDKKLINIDEVVNYLDNSNSNNIKDGNKNLIIGYLYEKNLHDLKKAFECYQKSADAGNINGMSEVAYMYEGRGDIAKDYSKSLYWYQKAAEAGDVDSMRKLGYIFKYGGNGINQDLKKSEEWYKKADTVSGNSHTSN